MKRTKRTVYLLPDLSNRIDLTAQMGGQSPNAIIETALDEHFARESMFTAVESLTRRVGEMDERVAAQQATLAEIETKIGAIGRAVVVIRDAVKPVSPAEPPAQPVAQERPPEHEGAARPAGGLLSGWRR